jgi:DNA polymerase III alpha subunit
MSSWEFTVEDDMIRVGLCAVKGLGEKAVNAIQDYSFDNLDELLNNEEINHNAFNKKAVQIAIFAGLFDFSLGKGENRRTLFEKYWRENHGRVRKRNPETKEMEEFEVPVPDEISVSSTFTIDTNKSEGGVRFENQFFDANFKLPKMTKKADYTAA